MKKFTVLIILLIILTVQTGYYVYSVNKRISKTISGMQRENKIIGAEP